MLVEVVEAVHLVQVAKMEMMLLTVVLVHHLAEVVVEVVLI
jgi:hypothetical protein